MKKVSTGNADHYKWGENCDGWWLKKGTNFSVIVESMPAGTTELKHLHRKSDQFFYCLEGSLAIEWDGEKQILSAHEGLAIPAGTAHKVSNASDGKVAFLLVSCPEINGDRVNLE